MFSAPLHLQTPQHFTNAVVIVIIMYFILFILLYFDPGT